MSRLIDADALIQEFGWCMEQSAVCNQEQWQDVIDRVGNAPTVDAITVVRCKDCRRQTICYHSENYFCADGEKVKE